MKRNKSSILLITAIILLAIMLHYKLHSKQNQSAETEQNINTQVKLNIGKDMPLFPSALFRLVEISL